MPKKAKYTNAQRKAYYSGMGYRTAREGKAINFTSDDMLASFREGYKRGGQVIAKNAKKYPKLTLLMKKMV